MSKKEDSIADAFDMMPLESAEIVVMDAPTEQADSYDMELARQNTHHLIQKGTAALDEILKIAISSEKARDFEVAANLIKTLSDLGKDLVDLQAKKKALSIQDEQPRAEVINNNLFVGTTEEFLEMLEEKMNANK